MFPERDEYCDEQDSYYDDRKYLFLIVCAKTQKSLLSKIPGGIPLLGIHNDIILLTRWFNGHLAAVMVVEYRTKDSIYYDDNEQQQSFLRRLIDAVETSAPPFLVVCDESGTLHVEGRILGSPWMVSLHRRTSVIAPLGHWDHSPPLLRPSTTLTKPTSAPPTEPNHGLSCR
jgi:hypothetical protein